MRFPILGAYAHIRAMFPQTDHPSIVPPKCLMLDVRAGDPVPLDWGQPVPLVEHARAAARYLLLVMRPTYQAVRVALYGGCLCRDCREPGKMSVDFRRTDLEIPAYDEADRLSHRMHHLVFGPESGFDLTDLSGQEILIHGAGRNETSRLGLGSFNVLPPVSSHETFALMQRFGKVDTPWRHGKRAS